MRRWIFLAVVASLLVLASGSATAAPEPQDSVDLAEVIRTITEREQRIESLTCTWKATSFMVKGAIPGAVVDPETGEQTIRRWPPADMNLYSTYAVDLDGGNVWSQKSGKAVNVSTGELEPLEHVEVLADGVHRMYCPLRNAGLENASYLGDSTVLAFLKAYRLLTTDLAQVRAEEVRLVGREDHEGHPCIVVEAPLHYPGQGGVTAECRWWLAEDLDWRLVRFVRLDGPTPGYSNATYRYERDEDVGVGWRLTGWDLGLSPQGRWMANEVTGLEFNVPVDVALFDGFPVGAQVGDWALGVSYVVGEPSEAERDALAREASDAAMDGFVRQVQSEAGPPAGAEDGPKPGTFALWTLAGLGLVLASGIALRRVVP